MLFLENYSSFRYKPGDIVLIEYWYSEFCPKNIITPVKIIEKVSSSYLITHNIPESKIFNAPDEKIKSSDIIDIYRK